MDTKWNGMDKDPGKNLESYVAAQVDRALNGAEDAPGVIRVAAKKHPRLRAWTGLFALLLGFALIAGSLCFALERWVTSSGEEWWKSDWQETSAFQTIISGYMLPFMTCLRELSLFMLLCTQGFILSTTLDYFDEMGLYAFSSGINLILIITILVFNTVVNKVTGASLDEGIGG